MNTTYVSASELKRNTAEILDKVHYGKNVTVVEKFGKAIAKIVPIEEKENDINDVEEILKATFGSIPDFPDVTSKRYFRRRDIKL